MKLVAGLLFATSALALVLVSERALQPRDAPLKSGNGWRNPNPKSTIGTRVGRMTGLRFTVDQFTWSFWSECTWNLVWYSGFGGELLVWVDEGQTNSEIPSDMFISAGNSGPTTADDFRKEASSNRFGRYEVESSGETLNEFCLGMPLNAPESEVAARIVRKEFQSINHLFDWAAYAARQDRREFVPTGQHATI